MCPKFQIKHGIPTGNKYFSIMQPCYENSGLDCSSIAYGIGLKYLLENPATKKGEYATLVHRRSCYTDSPLFETLALMTYGEGGDKVLDTMKLRYEGMMPEIVEIWTFKKES